MPKKWSAYKTKKKKQDFLIALEESFGVITAACRKTQVKYEFYKKWRQEDEEFDYACEEIFRGAVDFVESRLVEMIKQDNMTAIIFYLKCKAPEKWNDKSTNNFNLNIIGTEFQIGSNLDTTTLIDNNDNDVKLIEFNETEGE